jgi:hypothetical protein
LVAYFSTTKSALFSIGTAVRKDGQAILKAPNMQGETAETWIGFLSADEKDAACSVYTGAISL